MKKKQKSKNDVLIAGLGQGAREIAIQNGGGFIAVHKIHKSKKVYNRQKSRLVKNRQDDFFILNCLTNNKKMINFAQKIHII